MKLTWTPADWVSARLQVGDFQEAGNAASLLKDAYLHLAPSRCLEVRIGQFKKPFSRIELRGSATLKVAERGIGNSLIVEQFTSDSLGMIREDDRLQYGDRDIGIQLSGRLLKSVKLDYEVGVFNGTGPILTRKANSKDAVLRITATPSDWVKLGVNGSLKLFDKEERERENVSGENTEISKHPGWAAGADALFEAAGVRLHLEALLALDYRVIDQETPLVLNGIAILSYIRELDVSWKLAVEPVFKMEVLDPSSVYVDDIVMLYSLGFNVYLDKWVRLMIHADIQRVSRYTSESLYRKRNQRSSEQLIIQFCFDI